MLPETHASPKSPDGFFRLEPMQSRSSSGEAHLGFNHVADKDPFVAEPKRPWVSRRKSRKPEPPWKKYVITFRVAPVPLSFENTSPPSIGTESPPLQFGSFGIGNQILPPMDSSSTTSSVSGSEYSQDTASPPINNPEHMQVSSPAMIQSAKHETSFNDFFSIADVLLPYHQELRLPSQRERRSTYD